jgi:hypothetical protein
MSDILAKKPMHTASRLAAKRNCGTKVNATLSKEREISGIPH